MAVNVSDYYSFWISSGKFLQIFQGTLFFYQPEGHIVLKKYGGNWQYLNIWYRSSTSLQKLDRSLFRWFVDFENSMYNCTYIFLLMKTAGSNHNDDDDIKEKASNFDSFNMHLAHQEEHNSTRVKETISSSYIHCGYFKMFFLFSSIESIKLFLIMFKSQFNWNKTC